MPHYLVVKNSVFRRKIFLSSSSKKNVWSMMIYKLYVLLQRPELGSGVPKENSTH